MMLVGFTEFRSLEPQWGVSISLFSLVGFDFYVCLSFLRLSYSNLHQSTPETITICIYIYVSIHIICTILSSIKKKQQIQQWPFHNPLDTANSDTNLLMVWNLAVSRVSAKWWKGYKKLCFLWDLVGVEWRASTNTDKFDEPCLLYFAYLYPTFSRSLLLWPASTLHQPLIITAKIASAMLRRRNGRWCFHFSTNRSSSSPITRMNTLGVARQPVMFWGFQEGFPGEDPLGITAIQHALRESPPKQRFNHVFNHVFPSINRHLQRMVHICPYVPYIFRCFSHSFPFSSGVIVVSEPFPRRHVLGFVLNRPTTRSESYGRLEFNVWYGALILVISVPLLPSHLSG